MNSILREYETILNELSKRGYQTDSAPILTLASVLIQIHLDKKHFLTPLFQPEKYKEATEIRDSK